MRVFIGFDPRPAEVAAFAVTRNSLLRHIPRDWIVTGLILERLQKADIYTRPTQTIINSDGRRQLVDVLSKRDDYDGAISTEHAIARFLIPCLRWGYNWSLFMDGDMLVRSDLAPLAATLNSDYAVYCVKHDHRPSNMVKMDGQKQTNYDRKNWSSFMVFNCEHPSNRKLTLDLVNTLPGRDLHRFCWLEDSEIGELDPAWNWLVGHSDPSIDPKIVHFTSGVPSMPGYENVAFADEWRAELNRWAS